MLRRIHRLSPARFARAVFACVLAMLPLVAEAADASAQPWFAIDELGCPSPEGIRQNLERQLTSLGLDPRRLALAIRSQGPRAVQVLFTHAGDRFERVVRVSPAECPLLARTLALLVRGSVERPWRGLAEAFSDLETEEPTLPAVKPEPPPPPPVLVPTERRTWELTLLAGAITDAGHGALGGSCGIERALTPAMGIGLRVSAAGPFEAPAGGGRLAASPFEVGLLGRYRAFGSEAGSLDLLAGPALRLLFVRSESLRRNDSSLLPDAALELMGRASLGLGPRAALIGALGLTAGVTKRSFSVMGVGEVLTVRPVLVFASAGVRWSLD